MIHSLLKRDVLYEDNGIKLILCEVLQEICTQYICDELSRLAWAVWECQHPTQSILQP